MKTVTLSTAAGLAAEALQKGRAFLNVGGETPNTMTIGWGFIGYCWSRPVMTVVVRPQRHTHDILLEKGEFTVSFALDDSMQQQLAFAGTRSGSDVNKFEGHGITAERAQKVDAPIVKECALHIECKTRLTQPMLESGMDAETLDRCYPQRDLHTMVFGEIVACYVTEE